jgi:hypothetical protein
VPTKTCGAHRPSGVGSCPTHCRPRVPAPSGSPRFPSRVSPSRADVASTTRWWRRRNTPLLRSRLALPRAAAASSLGPAGTERERVHARWTPATVPGQARAIELRLFLAPLRGQSSSTFRKESARPFLRQDLLVHDGYHSFCGSAVEVLGAAALRAIVPDAGIPSRAPGSTGEPDGGERPHVGAHCPTAGPPPLPTRGRGRMCPLRPNAGEAACEDLAIWVVRGLPPPAFPDATPAPAVDASRMLAPPSSAPNRVRLD